MQCTMGKTAFKHVCFCGMLHYSVKKHSLSSFFVVWAVLLSGMVLVPGSFVFAHGEETPAEKLHAATQIGLIDSRSGHQQHGATGPDLSANFEVRLEPADPLPVAIPVDLRISIFKRMVGVQIKDFLKTHTKELHLIIVSPDMEEFYHMHPVLQNDGSFLLSGFVFPREIRYTMFFDLQPAETSGILLNREVTVGAGEIPSLQLQSSQFPVKAGGVSLNLVTDPPEPRSIGMTEMRFTFSDAKTGSPISDIKSYLGAAAHLVMLPESFDYLHVHPIGNFPTDPIEIDALNFGPEIVFHASFPKEGFYKGWMQLERRGKNMIETIPFTIRVEKGYGLTRNQVAAVVHNTQETEEARAVWKFALLSLFIFGMILLFYPRRPKVVPVTQTPLEIRPLEASTGSKGTGSLTGQAPPTNTL